jgi:hypothetical protein
VSEKNAIKRNLFAQFCIFTNETFDNCIFTDESIIELEINSPTIWRKKGCRNYRVGRPKHPLKVWNFLYFI